ncbi:hypothetical protein EDB86DRAFT_2830640 [Lactarius hatsudake]|nr:hypothetical protein EDB86DRAFT_2830640 [Lactarius hatsudake]
MALSTRRSCIIAANIRAAISQTNRAPSENALDSQIPADHTTLTQYATVIQNNPKLSGAHTTHGKRTFVLSDTATVLHPTPVLTEAPQGIPSKRARVAITEQWRNYSCTTSSFYPGCGDDTHPLASLQVDLGNRFDSDPEDNIENEDDWLEDKQTANITCKVSAKTSEVTVTERPSWLGADVIPPQTMQTPNRIVLDVDVSGSASSTPRFGTLSELRTPTVELSATATMSQTEVTTMTTKSSAATWPTDMDLLPPGAKRLLLTNQQTLVRNVVQEAIENLQASLLFNNAFPTAPIQDEEYLVKIGPLVQQCWWWLAITWPSRSAGMEKGLGKAAQLIVERKGRSGWTGSEGALRIKEGNNINSIIRGRCCVLAGVYDSETATDTVQQVVRLQLHNFNYTFLTKRGLLVRTPLHTQPYRNECIISAIRDLFFTGGMTSFVSCYNHLFPVHQGHNGTPAHEVPAPMVALVATAMYATLHEWCTGTPQVFEFSTNTYLEVYRSNTNTLNFILNNRPNAYHVMMADIYTQARRVATCCHSSNSGLDDLPMVEIADLDLDNLEE